MPHPHLPPRRRAGCTRDDMLGVAWGNEGSSVTCSAHQSLPLVWIEHYPKEATGGHSETFELVVFASYEVKERAPYLGETKLTIGEASWKPITRGMVEVLVCATLSTDKPLLVSPSFLLIDIV